MVWFIYNLQTGQWVSSFQAASDTVSGFSFHPYLPMAASSSGHRRFGVLDDAEEDFNLSGCTEHQKVRISGYSSILSPLASILVLVVRMVWFIYNLQTGQWVSSFQAASDTVSGFSFHPYLPMAASSSGHRRFGVLDDAEEEFNLSGDENCASVWSFSYYSSEIDDGSTDSGKLNGQPINENLLDDA